MSRTICLMGESGSGKTTAMRTLDPKTTYYIDCDRKGLSWKGWRQQYNAENKNYFQTRDLQQVAKYMSNIAEKAPHIKTIVIDTLNTAMVDKEVKEMGSKDGFERAKIKTDSFDERMTAYYTLLSQMRVQGGNAYIDFVKKALSAECTEKYLSENYDLKLYTDFSAFEKDMYYIFLL